MKCIKRPASDFGKVDNDTPFMIIRRVTEAEAYNAVVREGGWKYATRTEWKEAGRRSGLLGLPGG